MTHDSGDFFRMESGGKKWPIECEVLQTTSTKYKSRSRERDDLQHPGSSMPILGFGCYKVGVGGSWIWSGAMGRFDFELVKYLWMGTSWNILFLHQKIRRGFSVLYLYAFFWAATRHSSILQLLSLEKRTFSVFDFRWWLYSQTLKRTMLHHFWHWKKFWQQTCDETKWNGASEYSRQW